MTQEQRNSIYLKATSYLSYKDTSLCVVLNLASFELGLGNHKIDQYPEIMKYMPSDKTIGEYWFPLDTNGTILRFNILKLVIEETQK